MCDSIEVITFAVTQPCIARLQWLYVNIHDSNSPQSLKAAPCQPRLHQLVELPIGCIC